MLIPPQSGLKLSEGTQVQEVSPCDMENSGISLTSDRRNIVTKGESQAPSVLKVISEQKNSALPIFTNVLVTEICGVIVENNDGIINANPNPKNSPEKSKKWAKISLTDCFGRAFPDYTRLLNI